MSQRIRTTLCCAFVTGVTFAAGCGGGEPEVGAPPKPVVKHASAQALVETINRHAARAAAESQGDHGALQAENPGQREWLGFMQAILPIYELSIEMERQFGEGFDPQQSAFEMGLGGTADGWSTIRATGRKPSTRTSTAGSPACTLVKLDGDWWISGYTFEYDKDLQDITAEERAQSLAGINMMKGVTSGVLSRLRAGEFDSAQDVREAVFLAMAQKRRPRTSAAAARPSGRSDHGSAHDRGAARHARWRHRDGPVATDARGGDARPVADVQPLVVLHRDRVDGRRPGSHLYARADVTRMREQFETFATRLEAGQATSCRARHEVHGELALVLMLEGIGRMGKPDIDPVFLIRDQTRGSCCPCSALRARGSTDSPTSRTRRCSRSPTTTAGAAPS